MASYVTAQQIFADGRFQSGLAVEVKDGRFGDLAPRDTLPAEVDILDHGNVAILPGTVNSHGHSFQHLLRGRMDDCPWEPAIKSVMYPAAERLDMDGLFTGAQFAFAEALRSGTTTFVDFFYVNDDSNDNARAVIAAAKSVGIRLVLARTFYDVDNTNEAPQRYQETTEHAENHFRELAEEFRDDPLIYIQPAPHSMRAAGIESVRAAVRVAEEFDTPIHMHFHDTPARAAGARRFGDTPIRVLAKEGLLSERWIVVHAEPLDDEELDIIQSHGASVVYCPSPTMKSGGPGPETVKMHVRSITIALGCDGGCINNKQSIFEEMRLVSLLEKYRHQEGTPIDAAEAIRMGTEYGGKVLRLEVGAVDTGNWADYVCLDLDDLSLQPRDHLVQNIVYSLQESSIQSVWVGAQQRVQSGHILGIDEPDLVARVNDVVQSITNGVSK